MYEIKRVSYGKADTPKERREYRLEGSSPVGTITDWKDFLKMKGYNEMKVIELDESEEVLKW